MNTAKNTHTIGIDLGDKSHQKEFVWKSDIGNPSRHPLKHTSSKSNKIEIFTLNINPFSWKSLIEKNIMKNEAIAVGTCIIMWIATLIPVHLILSGIVQSEHAEAIAFKKAVKQGHTNHSINTQKLTAYEEDKSNYVKLAILTSLVISQTAILSSALKRRNSNQSH
ncbi:hypothetical protein SH580_04020 [Coraliomargarita algicola]|uniref:Transposase IS111A/IS1328/IS1533 N-terminal domain-containing protein n=1 Tax=Coraliomargarita algicola TaxID=3092156 RepID=A0ABZ0RLB7_9BACT|nr:hypothetical protein [Coraliomargarita sp. J2-16]WPJ96872.1 hypothetical protein SH580_04020 [Coraliomargarita sp. J2-16]